MSERTGPYLQCPKCKAAWDSAFPGARSLVDCKCEEPGTEISAEEFHGSVARNMVAERRPELRGRQKSKGERLLSEMKWDDRFLDLAFLVASWSKDPSSKNGAVLVRPDRTISSLGYNGFAQGMSDNPRLYQNRELKYDRVIHAEMNALLFARDPLPMNRFTLYTTAPNCSRCVVHAVQMGIRQFVWGPCTPEQAERWGVQRTREYLEEVGATVREPKRK